MAALTEAKPFRASSIGSDTVVGEVFADETLEQVYDRIRDDLDSVYALFQTKREEQRRNVRFVKGEQWSEDEIDAHKIQNRIPYVFDQISPKVNSLLGVHEATRVDVRVVAAEPGDDQAAAISNRMIKWFEQINRMDDLEREVFYDVVVKGVGATVVRWSLTDTLSGIPVLERVPIYQLVWDSNSTDSTLADARWICRRMPMTRQDALEEMPQFAEHIMAAGSAPAASLSSWTDYDAMTQRQIDTLSAAAHNSEIRDLIDVIEHYEKVKRYVWVVSDTYANTIQEFEEAQDAEAHANGLTQGYLELDAPVVTPDGEDLVQVIMLSRDTVIQTIVIDDRVVSREVTNLPDFPFQVTFAYFDDGDYWSFVDELIDPQIYLNRMMSELDNQVGRGNKNTWLVNVNKLGRGFGLDDLNRERSKTAATIPVLAPDAVHMLPNAPAQSELLQGVNFAITHMMEAVGGKNSLGLQENAAESGMAVRARQEAAGMGRLPVFAHMSQWRRKVSEQALWYMRNFLAPSQQLRIIGSDGEIDWVNIDAEALDSLSSARVDIIIKDGPDTETSRERQFVELKELFQTLGPAVPGDIVAMMMLEYSSIPEASKNKIRAQIASMQQYQEQQQKKEELAKMEKSVTQSLLKSQMKEQKQRELMAAQQAPMGGA